MEQTSNIKRSELYYTILNLVKRIPRKEVEGDAADAPSVAYDLEQLFLKKEKKSLSDEIIMDIIQFTRDSSAGYGMVELKNQWKQKNTF